MTKWHQRRQQQYNAVFFIIVGVCLFLVLPARAFMANNGLQLSKKAKFLNNYHWHSNFPLPQSLAPLHLSQETIQTPTPKTPTTLSLSEVEHITPVSKRSKRSIEFFNMAEKTASQPLEDISALPSARDRAMFLGAKAAIASPPVARAFEILYEDWMALRVAGRMIARHLDEQVEDVRAQRMEDGRRAFLALKGDNEREGLTMDELVASGIVATAVELFGFESFDEFLEKMQRDEKGLLSFEEFVIGLQRCAADSTEDYCSIPDVLREVTKRMEAFSSQEEEAMGMATTTTVELDAKKKKYNDRFDAMVDTFREWEERVPDQAEGRMWEVMKGCFVGAQSEEIVDALRIVYIDYSALRVAGDLVFKLSKNLMGKRA